MLKDVYTFIDMNIVFFNFVNFIIGLSIILYNLKGLTDCENILVLSSISALNSLIVISWCINLCNNRFCSFVISTILLIYNLINYYGINSNCVNYFSKEALVIWYYYIVNIFIQGFNIISYLILFCLAFKLLNSKETLIVNRQANLNNDIYDDDDVLIEDFEKII